MKAEVLITGDRGGLQWNLAVWDADTGATLKTYKGNSSAAGTLTRIGADYLVSAQPDKPLLNVWQTHRAEQASLRLFTPGKCTALTAPPSGKYLLAAVEEKISVWQVSTGRLWRVLAAHYQPVTRLVFTSDGTHFVSAGEDGQVLYWSLAVVVSARTLPGLKVGQVGRPEPRWSWRDHALAVTDVHVTAGGCHAKIASVSGDQTCKVFCPLAGQLLLSVSFPVGLASVVLDASCDHVYVGGDNGSIYSFSLQSPPRTVSVSINDTALEPRAPIKAHAGRVTHLAISLDGSQLASGGSNSKDSQKSGDNTGSVKLWHVKSGQCVRTLDHRAAITTLQFVVPPIGMLNPDAYQPTRKLVALQKGFDEQEPFVAKILSREEKQLNRLEPSSSSQNPAFLSKHNAASAQDNASTTDEKMSELMDINQQLYKFAVQNILHKPTVPL